jgi:hypothetical protein
VQDQQIRWQRSVKEETILFKVWWLKFKFKFFNFSSFHQGRIYE